MSAAGVLEILRRNATASVRDVPALKRLLRDLLAYNKTPLTSKPTFGAALRIEALPQRFGSSRHTVDVRVPMQLWPAVFPWESARGLSHTPRDVLCPTPPATAPASAGGGLVVPPEQQASLLRNSRLNPGMLFLMPEVDFTRPVAFWSGGITTGLDVAFLQPFKEDSFVKRMASLTRAPDGPPSKSHVGDIGALVPFSVDEGPHQVQSRCTAVEMVLEMRRGWFAEALKALRSELPEDAQRALGTAELPDCRMTLELSEALNREMLTKGQLFAEYVAGIALHVNEAIRSCNVPAKDSAAKKEGGAATLDFEGTPEDATRGRPSAAAESKFPRTSVDVPRLPPLDYELVTLAYQLNLGMEAIGRCSNRIVDEVQRLVATEKDVQLLHELVIDPAVDLYPPELGPLVLLRTGSP